MSYDLYIKFIDDNAAELKANSYIDGLPGAFAYEKGNTTYYIPWLNIEQIEIEEVEHPGERLVRQRQEEEIRKRMGAK
jgi:hypothetical protein